MKLTVIIISYNTKNLLDQTLESLPQYKNWEVFVVDNASSDDSVTLVETKYPWVKVIKNTKNVGFARANNQVLGKCNSDYAILLNSDTKVVPGAIESLIAYMDSHPDVAAITPKVVLSNGKIDPACHRGMPTPWRSLCYYSGLEKQFPNSTLFGGYHQAYLGLDTDHEIETTAGTAMLVRMDAIKEVGLLDEQFFMYAEDLDWCLRIREKGWKIIYYPEAIIYHYKSQSGMKNKSRTSRNSSRVYFYDTMWQFYQKHYISKYPAIVSWLMYGGIKLKKWLALH